MDKIKEYIPGYLQGLTRVCISYPFDYIRIFLQVDNKENVLQIIKKSNSLFRGLFIPLLSVPFDRAITFNLYETLKDKKYNKFECAVYPSILSSIYMTPINIVNYNYIFYKQNFKATIKDCLNKNMYRGNLVELTRNTCSSSLFLISYNYLSSNNKNNNFMNGSISSILMWAIMYPLDTIKTKKFVENKTYQNIFVNTRIIDYYRGFSLVLLKTVPSAGFGMVVYETTKQNLL